MNYTAIIIAALVFFAVIAVAKMLVERNLKAKAIEQGREVKSIVLPLRLQAYERMALFLDRIEPNNLVLRIHAPNLTVAEEKSLLLTAIRSEFEHNITQQIYISDAVWQQVCNAKDDIIEIINTVADQMDGNADNITFAESVLTASAQHPVIANAMKVLRNDVQKIY